jgi:hypothetical protein
MLPTGIVETRPSENEMKGIPQLEAVFAECAIRH